MQRVFVLDSQRRPLMPCHPARVRKLLQRGRAAVFRHYPFTIILSERAEGSVQPIALKVDPGSQVTGIALVAEFLRGQEALWAANLNHRGQAVKHALDTRRAVRQSRRCRKTRYRTPRFNNRRCSGKWLSPSLLTRVGNVQMWGIRLCGSVPVAEVYVETVRFDTQAVQNPEISGVEYQQGELFGYEVREYLLEKWERRCAYCSVGSVPLEIEHIIPISRGGTDRISNLTLACVACNRAKGSRNALEFGHPEVQVRARQTLRDMAAVNATRYAVGQALRQLGLPISFWSGGRTKYNRRMQGYEKEHWIDAICVGKGGDAVRLPPGMRPLCIHATGRGCRQMCRMDRYGFPRTRSKQARTIRGFRTGDLVRATIATGKQRGYHSGRVAVRTRGYFRIRTTTGIVDGIHYRYCRLIQRGDGYKYLIGGGNPPCD
jgi:5-methylcytosine-specific restriction endonuclease McrA